MSVVSESTSESVSVSIAPDMESMIASLKGLEVVELFKVIKHAVSEAEKRAKSAGKMSTKAKSAAAGGSTKKAGSMPKGQVPPQLRKPRAWVEFVLKHALENGWESFTVFQTRKDKKTGEKVEEEIEMPGSVLHEGTHIYEDSITEKQPAGKQLIQKDAMSLSKHYWAPKAKTGAKPELYEAMAVLGVMAAKLTVGLELMFHLITGLLKSGHHNRTF